MRIIRREGVAYAQKPPVAANDNETSGQREVKRSREQERVRKLRALKAQVVLASEAEAYDQMQKEEVKAIRYLPAGAVATLKDLSDWVLIGSIPVIGTLISLFCSVLIFILSLTAKKNSGLEDMGFIIRRLLIVAVGFLIEGFVFGVNFFPFEIATVFIIYLMDKHLSRKQIEILRKTVAGLNKKAL